MRECGVLPGTHPMPGAEPDRAQTLWGARGRAEEPSHSGPQSVFCEDPHHSATDSEAADRRADGHCVESQPGGHTKFLSLGWGGAFQF